MTTNRRDFLKSAALAAMGCRGFDPRVPASAWQMMKGVEQSANDAIIVAILLYGGNDGLNTVVPIGDAEYAIYQRLRPSLRIPRDQILTLSNIDQPNGPYGLNPVMTALKEVYDRGKLAIIAGVGVPRDSESKFDHAAGIYDFVSADPYHFNFHTSRPTGWVGRAIDDTALKLVPPGLDFGGGNLLLAGPKNRPLSLGSITDFQLLAGNEALAAYRDLMEYERPDSPIAELNRSLCKSALDNGNALREKTKAYKPAIEYPQNNSLADSLRDIASVIWAGMGARGFSVALGGFDTHKEQNRNNFHFALLKLFSDAVAAFYNDLSAQNISRKVIILTISDFGRRPEENVDRGTDHGYANCCFVIGDGVRGGMWGLYPSLESSKLVFNQNLDISVDYRTVFATILARHFDLDPKPILGVSEMLGFL